MDGEITPDELHDLLEAGDDGLRVVDIRDEASFERGRVPESVNVPFHEFSARIEELEDAERIVTVCPHGKASVQAARLVGSYEGCADARVESLAGGIEEWAEAYDLEAGTESEDGRDDGGAEAASAEGPDAPF